MTNNRPAMMSRVPVFLLVTLASAGSVSSLAQDQAVAWKTGNQLVRQLQMPAGRFRSTNTLRGALVGASEAWGVAVFLDRRIDPDQAIDVNLDDLSVQQVIERIAQHVGQAVCRIGSVVYLGPPDTASILAIQTVLLAEQVGQFPDSRKAQLNRHLPLRVAELQPPRAEIGRIAANAGVDIVGLDGIPHDLWPEIDLPPMSFVQRMSLMLAGFGYTFEFSPDGLQIRLLPLTPDITADRTYRLSTRQATVQAIGRQFPDAVMQAVPGGVRVKARLPVHQRLWSLLEAKDTRVSEPIQQPGTQTVYSLQIQDQPVGGVVKALAGNLGWEVQFDPGTGDSIMQRVTFEVKDASIQELLEALLEPVGLSYRLRGKQLQIVPVVP